MTTSNSSVSSVRSAISGSNRLNLTRDEFQATFKPAFDWCLIKMTDRESSTPDDMKASGIIEIECVRQQARNKDGTVIAIGPHEYDVDYKKTFPPDFNIGDRVYYSAWSGRETPCPEGYLLIRSGDLSLILDEDTSITWI